MKYPSEQAYVSANFLNTDNSTWLKCCKCICIVYCILWYMFAEIKIELN